MCVTGLSCMENSVLLQSSFETEFPTEPKTCCFQSNWAGKLSRCPVSPFPQCWDPGTPSFCVGAGDSSLVPHAYLLSLLLLITVLQTRGLCFQIDFFYLKKYYMIPK